MSRANILGPGDGCGRRSGPRRSGSPNHQPRLIAAMPEIMEKGKLLDISPSAFGFSGEGSRRRVPTHRGAWANRARLESRWRAREVNMADTVEICCSTVL